MNVNLTPPVEPGKVASVAKSGAVSTDTAETEASGGFFAQLHALIFGSKTSSDEPAASATQVEDAEVTADAGMSSDSEPALTAEMDDALLSATDLDTTSDESTNAAAVKPDQKAPPLEKGEATSAKPAQTNQAQDSSNTPVPASLAKWVKPSEAVDDAQVSDELQRKTAQAMSEGDKILGRLQESNQVLSKTNGKTLPVQHGQALDKHTTELAENESLSAEITAQAPSSEARVLAAQGAKPTSDELKNAAVAQASEDEKTQDELMAAALLGGAITGVSVVKNQPASTVAEDIPIDAAQVASSNVGKSEAALVDNQLMIKAKTPSTAAQVQAPVHGITPTINDALTAETSVAESGKVAIPWATQAPTEHELAAVSPELKALLEEGGKTKTLTPNPSGQSIAQGITPAHLAAQQAASTAVPVNPTAATPVDMAALAPQAVAVNPMVNPASTVNPELAASSAMLAALGGRALAGGDERRATNESGHEGLAQQIAAAAGQGVGQNQALHRAESQAVQANATPLHLNKEMAADQLAERVQVMMSKNLKNIDIRLDPPEMGRMHIRMNMQGDGATVHFTVANQHARDALEQTMPRLREMLAQQGVQLGDTSVQQQSAGQQQRYAGQEQSGFGQTARNEQHNSEENLDTDVKLDLNVATKRDGISYYA
ncbi:flagellar hook-length control protein FliK [Vibrio metoecus]|nr:flagellar hook-length control protein FliK [Vibrio metoecus]WKY93808.1 flagellar hook-length control protein FliK [Vibrio metoecus]